MDELAAIKPEDDSGSDTIARLRFQAEFAFPFCVAMAQEDGPVAIYVEHHEDIVLYTGEEYTFIQVKTRDSFRLWATAEILQGPLKSLHRAYAATKQLKAIYVAALQGRVSPDCPVNAFVAGDAAKKNEAVAITAETLKISAEDAESFLARVRITERIPSAEGMAGRNFRLLRHMAGSASSTVQEEVHRKLTDLLMTTMGDTSRGDQWYYEITKTPGGHPKRVTAADVAPILAPVTRAPRQRLLKRITSTIQSPPSILEEKLLAGSATDEIITSALDLRANAAIREAEILAGGDAPEFEDFLIRLSARNSQIRATAEIQERPAVAMWNSLLGLSTDDWKAVDQNRLFDGDPFLLVGEFCNLADQCVFDFGGAKIG